MAELGTMDVGELLSYQPNRGTKRPRDDEEEELKCVGDKLVLESGAATGRKN